MAAAHALLEGQYRDGTEIAFESKSGILRVLREEDDLALDFPVQRRTRCEVPKTLINDLGIEPSEYYRAGDYLAVFDASSDVAARSPDFRARAEFDLRGVIVTAPGESEDLVSRFFALKFGIDEDQVTVRFTVPSRPIGLINSGRTFSPLPRYPREQDF